MSELHQMLYMEHLAALPALTDNAFDTERGLARSEYRRAGELRVPWLQWTPQRTAADLWRASRERRKDPEHMRRLHELQRELDDEANKIAAAVQEELELRKAAQQFRQREMEESRKPIGRRYARHPKKRRRI